MQTKACHCDKQFKAFKGFSMNGSVGSGAVFEEILHEIVTKIKEKNMKILLYKIKRRLICLN